MPHERKRDWQLGAAKRPIHNGLGVGGAVPRDPREDVFEIGERLIVEDKLHTARY
jgi:hypothetical protein